MLYLHFSLLAVLGSVLLSGCDARPSGAPDHPDLRIARYRLIAAAGRTGSLGVFAEHYEDEARTVFGDTEISGVDGIAENWKRIMNGAAIEDIQRVSAGTELEAPTRLVDSGTVMMRMRIKGELRDTIMAYKTLWILNGSAWRIRRDEIRSK